MGTGPSAERMRVLVTRGALERMWRHARLADAVECCGLLLGDVADECRIIRAAEPVSNSAPADQSHRRYRIDPADYLRLDRHARQRGWDILGCYHSHPTGSASPSEVDLDLAWPWYLHMILALQPGRDEPWNCWVLQEHDDAAGASVRRFARVPAEVVGDEPFPPGFDDRIAG